MNVEQIPQLLFEQLAVSDDASYLRKFQTLKTNADRVNFVYEDLKKYKLLPPFIKDGKNDAEAEKNRDNGNKLYFLGEYEKALKAYTQSVKFAKSKSVLALAFANRSICLLKLGLRNECLEDIERALSNDYPHNPKKLHDRRRCAEQLQKSRNTYYDPPPEIPANERSPLIECAKDSVRIEKDETFGKHVVACRDIQIGEVLAVEKPFSCSLMSDFLVHCHQCMELTYNPIPCDGCTYYLFCGLGCKEKAMTCHHKFVCPILKSLIEGGMSSTLLALIVTLLASADFPVLDTFEFDKEKEYRSDRYEEVHSLAAETEKRNPMDLFCKSVVAAAIFDLLDNHTDFFQSENARETFKDVLLHQQQVCNINSIYISERIIQSKSAATFGAGLYSFSSLFNHSCHYNAVRFHHGATIVLRAFTTIRKGEQCFISYGYQYDRMSKADRQAALRDQYFFVCKCRACQENWVYPSGMAQTYHIDLRMSADKFNSIYLKIRGGDTEVAKRSLPVFIKALKKCEKKEPKGNAMNFKDLIYLCYEILGNRRME